MDVRVRPPVPPGRGEFQTPFSVVTPRDDAVDLLIAIIAAQAAYETEHQGPPKKLRSSSPAAQQLAGLGREHLGELSDRLMREGTTAFEQVGLLGVPVEIIRGPSSAPFAFE